MTGIVPDGGYSLPVPTADVVLQRQLVGIFAVIG
jgi:hypothetical protein